MADHLTPSDGIRRTNRPHRARRHWSPWLAPLALPIVLACASVGAPGPTDPDPNDPGPPPTTGAMSITIRGLPVGVLADVTLVGGAAGPVTVTASSVLADLAPGAYDVIVRDVCRDGATTCGDVDLFLPETTALGANVVAGASTEVDVTYECAALEPPDANLASALLAAVRAASGDDAAPLSCRTVGTLTELVLERNGIEDLEGMQAARRLEHLSIWGEGAITDLSPLADLVALETLRIGPSFPGDSIELADLTPIARLPRLATLSVTNSNVTALPDLGQLTALRVLSIASSPKPNSSHLVDLTPLAGVPWLEELSIYFCQPTAFPERSPLADITPLAGLTSLTRLVLSCHSIADVSPLAAMTSLVTLGLEHNQIVDVTPLGDLTELEVLFLGGNGVRSIDAIASWPRLVTIGLNDNPLSDIRPIYLHGRRHGALERVSLTRTCIRGDRVPAAGYVAALDDAGVVVQHSPGGTCFSVPTVAALSTFEVDGEDWTTSGDASPHRHVTSGGPDGAAFLEADDLQQGVTWYWDAPAHFLGNAGAFFGGNLVFWLRQSSTTNGFVDSDVILEGAGHTLTYRHGGPIGTDWTRVEVPLYQERAGDPWQQGADPAAEVTLQEVLGSLTRMRIRGEFRTGADTGGIGLVWFGPPPPL